MSAETEPGASVLRTAPADRAGDGADDAPAPPPPPVTAAGPDAATSDARDRVADVLPLRPAVPTAVELAAGTLCWRESGDGRDPERSVEVLLVHRPKYDDWSFPKGKVEPGETLPECAVRETGEETGVRVRLGRPLPALRYTLPDGRPKEVSFWVSRPMPGGAGRPHPKEVDEVVWLSVRAARKRLTHPSEMVLLDAVVGMAAEHRLRTRPFLVVRHATARPRQAWTHADADRPLVAAGRRQALALAALLQCWSPDHLLSSPWLRCTETLAPYAAATGARVRTKGGLSEDGWSRDPRKAARHAQRLIERDQATALCTHRPVLPGVVSAVARAGAPDVVDALPDADPYLDPAEVLVVHVAGRPGRRPLVVAVERHAPHR